MEKKASIQRSKELMRNQALHDKIRANVMHSEKEGISLSLKNSTLMKNMPLLHLDFYKKLLVQWKGKRWT